MHICAQAGSSLTAERELQIEPEAGDALPIRRGDRSGLPFGISLCGIGVVQSREYATIPVAVSRSGCLRGVNACCGRPENGPAT